MDMFHDALYYKQVVKYNMMFLGATANLFVSLELKMEATEALAF